MVGLPWELPWTAGSQQLGWGEVCHGRWRCVGCHGAGSRWSSLFGPPCALDPGDAQAPAVLGARSVTSQPVEGENSGNACRGHTGPGKHWGPQPTQGQRQEGGVQQTRHNNMLEFISMASGISLSHPESVKAIWGIVVEYNIMIEGEGSQRFLYWEYVIVLRVRVKDAFMFQGGYAMREGYWVNIVLTILVICTTIIEFGNIKMYPKLCKNLVSFF